MNVRLTTGMNAIAKSIAEAEKKLIEDSIKRLIYIGEKCVNKARNYNAFTYKDQTGNLRSSVSYVVVHKGNIVSGTPEKRQWKTKGKEGFAEGESYASQLAREVPVITSEDAPILIIVAGMKYASYVADKGYDVLDSAELLAESLLNKLL